MIESNKHISDALKKKKQQMAQRMVPNLPESQGEREKRAVMEYRKKHPDPIAEKKARLNNSDFWQKISNQ